MFVIIKFKFNLLIYNINNFIKNYYKSVCSVLIETIVHIYKVSLKKKKKDDIPSVPNLL